MKTQSLVLTVTLLLAGAARGQALLPAIDFIHVPGGCFQMGSEIGEKHEKPVHKACVDSFEIGRTEISQAQWQAVMEKNPSKFSACGDTCPVEQVSWDDSQEFIKRLNGMKQGVYRLPTEAEWEYVCRSGGKDQQYAGDVSATDVAQIAWFKAESGSSTHPVATKKPNGLGVYDMNGNVWEWVQDMFVTPYDITVSQNNPRVDTGPENKRVIRGGSWRQAASFLRCANRSRYEASHIDPRIGLRLVREIAK